MYARRSTDGSSFRPASLGAALAINGGVVAALLLAAPEVFPDLPEPPLTTIFIAPTPTPTPPQPQPTARTRQPVAQPTAQPDPGPSLDDLIKPVETRPGPELEMGGGTGGGGDVVTDPPQPLPRPALVGARFDPRYADDIEPNYPDSLRDAGVEGLVRLRITIGADGRVRRAEPLAGDPALLRIAVRHVLARWRFRPTTRGGVAEESSKVMTVRFRLND